MPLFSSQHVPTASKTQFFLLQNHQIVGRNEGGCLLCLLIIALVVLATMGVVLAT